VGTYALAFHPTAPKILHFLKAQIKSFHITYNKMMNGGAYSEPQKIWACLHVNVKHTLTLKTQM
jgi:hypothetical protein